MSEVDVVGDMTASLEIYIKIGPRKVCSRMVVRFDKLGPNLRQTMAKSYPRSVKERRNKGTNKDLEYSEDEEVTLPNVRQPTRPSPP